MIVHVEYRCPECDKVFNCPANLASHRRWHKPKPHHHNNNNNPSTNGSSPEENNNKPGSENGAETTYTCEFCFKPFKRPSGLKKHLLQSHPEQNNEPKPGSKYSIAELLSPSKKDKKSISCHLCTESFPNMADLTLHLSQSHASPTKNEPSLTPPQPYLPILSGTFSSL